MGSFQIENQPDLREPLVAARVAPGDRGGELPVLGRDRAQVRGLGVAVPGGGPPRRVGGEVGDDAESHLARPPEEIVVGGEAGVGAGVGGVERGSRGCAGAGRDLVPLDPDAQRVDAETLQLGERLAAARDAEANERSCGPRRSTTARRGASARHAFGPASSPCRPAGPCAEAPGRSRVLRRPSRRGRGGPPRRSRRLSRPQPRLRYIGLAVRLVPRSFSFEPSRA